MVIPLERLYDSRIGDNSILCTYSHKSYVQFAHDFSLDRKRVKRGKHKEEIYHGINVIISIYHDFI